MTANNSASKPEKLLDATSAHAELADTGMAEIERATALTWGGRALASYQRSESEANSMESIARLSEGDTFRGEALEHAAVADSETLGPQIRRELDAARKTALVGLETRLA